MSNIIKYFWYSIISTVFDVILVLILLRVFKVTLVYANTVGVLLGFAVHYILASKSVFDFRYGILGFSVYAVTFLFGLALADYIIYISYNNVFYFLKNSVNFLLSKCASIVIPFFILYFMRKYIYFIIKKYKGD